MSIFPKISNDIFSFTDFYTRSVDCPILQKYFSVHAEGLEGEYVFRTLDSASFYRCTSYLVQISRTTLGQTAVYVRGIDKTGLVLLKLYGFFSPGSSPSFVRHSDKSTYLSPKCLDELDVLLQHIALLYTQGVNAQRPQPENTDNWVRDKFEIDCSELDVCLHLTRIQADFLSRRGVDILLHSHSNKEKKRGEVYTLSFESFAKFLKDVYRLSREEDKKKDRILENCRTKFKKTLEDIFYLKQHKGIETEFRNYLRSHFLDAEHFSEAYFKLMGI